MSFYIMNFSTGHSFFFSMCLASLISRASGVITFFGQDVFDDFRENHEGPYPNSDAEQQLFLSYLTNAEVETFDEFDQRAYTSLTIETFKQAGEVTLRTGPNTQFSIQSGTALMAGRYPVEGEKFVDALASVGGLFLDLAEPIAAFGFYGIDMGDFQGDIIIQTLLNGNDVKSYNIEFSATGSILDGNVLFFGLIDTDLFNEVRFVTNGDRDFFAFDKFTIGSIEQIVTCQDKTVIVDGNCDAKVPSLEDLFTQSNADSLDLYGLPQILEPGENYTYEITATYLTGTSLENTDVCTGVVQVLDVDPPEVTCFAYDNGADNTCSATVEPIGSATDNCAIASEIQDPPVGTSFGLGAHTISFTATDTSGNTAICSEVFTVTDNTALDIACADIPDMEADSNCEAVVPNIGTAFDNCGTRDEIQSYGVGERVGLGLQTVTFSAQDNQGNTGTCSSSFTVRDTSPPEVTCMENEVLQADENCEASIPEIGSTSDNCGADGVQEPVPDSAIPLGRTSITYIAEDGAGNTASCSTIFTVEDSILPIVSCVDDVVESADENCQANLPDIGVAVDNCDLSSEVQSPRAGLTISTVGDTSLQFTATDSSDNTASCSTLFTMVDRTPPEVTCHEEVERVADENCQAVITNINRGASDNCGLDTEEQEPPVGTTVDIGNREVTYTATDDSDNSASCSTIFRVVDTTTPEVTCFNDILLNAGNNCDAQVPKIGTATDNCGVNTEEQVPTVGTTLGVGTRTISFVATDDDENSASCETVITVVDNSIPSVACIPDFEQDANENCMGEIPLIGTSTDNCGIASEFQQPAQGEIIDFGEHSVQYTARDNSQNAATCTTTMKVVDRSPPAVSCDEEIVLGANDNCEGEVPIIGAAVDNCGVLTQGQLPRAGETVNIGSTFVRFTASDTSSNVATCSSMLRVIDNASPIVECVPNMVQTADERCEVRVPRMGTSTDNCGVSNEVQQPSIGSIITDAGDTEVSYTARDLSNNLGTCSTTLTLIDDSPPDVTCRDSVEAYVDGNCEVEVPNAGTATDNCGLDTEIQQPSAGTVVRVGDHSITYTARDSSFNTASCTTSINAVDNTPPKVECIPDLIYNADLNCEGAVPGIGSATDNCGITSESQSPQVGEIVGLGDTVITYTVSDSSGNTASCSTTFSVRQLLAVAVRCSPSVEADADENCEAAIPMIGEARSTCGAQLSTQDQFPPPGNLVRAGETNLTFSALGRNGGAPASCSGGFVVRDVTPPEQSSQDPICLWPPNNNFYCESLSTLVQGTDNCDDPIISFAGCSSSPANEDSCLDYCVYDEDSDTVCFRADSARSYLVEARAEDTSGNENYFSRIVNVLAASSTVDVSSCSTPSANFTDHTRHLGYVVDHDECNKDVNIGKGKGKGKGGESKKSGKGGRGGKGGRSGGKGGRRSGGKGGRSNGKGGRNGGKGGKGGEGGKGGKGGKGGRNSSKGRNGGRDEDKQSRGGGRSRGGRVSRGRKGNDNAGDKSNTGRERNG